MNDDRLSRLLHETVDDLTPADRLDDIREVVNDREVPMPARRYAVAAVAAVATAGVLGVVAWAGGILGADPTEPPAHQPTVATDPSTTPTDSTDPSPGAEESTAAIYWLGDTPQGVRLYREFQDVSGTTPLEAALVTAIAGSPDDPDYRTPWSGTELVTARVDGEVILIELDRAPAASDARNAEEAALALEQLIRTAQAAIGRRLPIQFAVAGNVVAELFGQPTSEPLVEGEWSEVLALVSLSDPAEGTTVPDDVLAVRGVASSFEATVPWRILHEGAVVVKGSFTAEGWVDRLHPFDGEIDLTDLAPGEYVLEVATADPSGGAEGPGPFRDTRTFEVR